MAQYKLLTKTLNQQKLIDLFAEHGEQKKVAKALGCSSPTVNMLRKRFNLRLHTIAVPITEKEKRSEGENGL